jgi:hypothetical protein
MVFKLDREPEAGASGIANLLGETVLHRLHRLDSGSSGSRTSLMYPKPACS